MARAGTSIGWAPAAPVLCALHCVAMPAVVAAMPGLAVLSTLEGPLLVLSALLCGWLLFADTRIHRDRRALTVAFVGLAAWSASLMDVFAPAPESLTTVAGSLTVAIAMIWSRRLRHRAEGEACPCPTC